MKICWFGLYDKDYSRNSILINGLKTNGSEVLECNALSVRGIRKYSVLIKKLRALNNDYDFLYCAFPINYNVIIGYFFQNRPIVIDAFYPLYEAYVIDRKVYSKFGIKANTYRFLDWVNTKLATHIIVDTEEHKQYWTKYCDENKISVIPVGADDRYYYPNQNSNLGKQDFLVVFHGSYIPLQGIEKIVASADILRNIPNIKFRFIGKGQLFDLIKSLIVSKDLEIDLVGWLSQEELNNELNKASVILGIFGDGKKTDRVVPNKVFQGMAVRKPVITKRTPAVEGLLKHNVLMVENEPKSIAESILGLMKSSHLAKTLAVSSYEVYRKNFTPLVLGGKLHKVFKALNEKSLR